MTYASCHVACHADDNYECRHCRAEGNIDAATSIYRHAGRPFSHIGCWWGPSHEASLCCVPLPHCPTITLLPSSCTRIMLPHHFLPFDFIYYFHFAMRRRHSRMPAIDTIDYRLQCEASYPGSWRRTHDTLSHNTTSLGFSYIFKRRSHARRKSRMAFWFIFSLQAIDTGSCISSVYGEGLQWRQLSALYFCQSFSPLSPHEWWYILYTPKLPRLQVDSTTGAWRLVAGHVPLAELLRRYLLGIAGEYISPMIVEDDIDFRAGIIEVADSTR